MVSPLPETLLLRLVTEFVYYSGAIMSGQPYTHAMHAHRCHQSAQNGASAVGLLVQVQKRGVTYCARISTAWTTPDGLDCCTVESITPEIARFTVPVKQVRACGDAGCNCGETA